MLHSNEHTQIKVLTLSTLSYNIPEVILVKTVILFAVLILTLVACGRNDDAGGRLPMLITDWTGIAYDNTTTNEFYIGEVLSVVGDDQPVPRRVVAQMLAGIGALYSGEFPRDEMLTLEQAQDIMTRLHPSGRTIYISDENKNAYISYALWVELFIQLVEAQDDHGVEAVNIIPLGVSDSNNILTNLGEFGGKSINLTSYFDREIRVLHRGRDVLAVIGVTDFFPTLKNAMITHSDAFGISVFIGGAARNYVYSEGALPLQDGVTIANIQINGQEILSITPAEAVITGTIERVRSHAIELREWGAVPLCPSFAVYGAAVTTRSLQDLLVGTNTAEFYVIGGRIGAAVILRDETPTNIRVVIGTCNFGGLVHDSVTITGTGAFTMRVGGSTEHFAAGQHLTIDNNLFADGVIRLYISLDDPVNHRLEITGLTRNWPDGASPRYRGAFEISRNNGGNGFIIVNELCIEDYLKAVIPSEMPTSHGVEAAKVQAITARSFALHQIYQNAFREFGAHVDDSVISQVYNNIPETDVSVAATAATRGQVLTVDGELVIANYFSTSSGMTANFGEVWATGSTFPSHTPVHLRAMPQFTNHDPGDLTLEENAAAFFRSHDIPAFDREFAWFRWQTRLTADQLSAGINASLAARRAANPAMIQISDANADSIGQIISMEIVRRGQGGNVMEMIFTGTEATARVQTEFNIRALLNPGNVPVVRHNGTQVSNLQLLPSAFFTMEKEIDANGHIAAVTFFGGGNGHGVGMSQNGVRAFVDMGMTYPDILRHYYPGAQVTQWW